MSELAREEVEKYLIQMHREDNNYGLRCVAEVHLKAHDAALRASREAERERADIAERSLLRNGYRKSCDIAVCNCGDQWNHGGHANERLREIKEALPYENGKTLLQRVEGLVTQLADLTAQLVASEQRVTLLQRTIDDHVASYTLLEQRQITTAQQLAASEQRVKELEGQHCKDCCCARSWAALGINMKTTLSIPEHITQLKQHLAEAQNTVKELHERLQENSTR